MPFDNSEVPRAAQILLRAADLIEHNHLKGRAFDIAAEAIAAGAKPTRYCAAGALALAQAQLDDVPLSYVTERGVYHDERLHLLADIHGMSALVRANDLPATTGADMAAHLRRRAAAFVT